jgi:hypothetical protein
MVLAGGSELIDDIRRAPDDVLSGREAFHEVRSMQNGELILMGIMKSLQVKYTLDLLNPKDGYSTEIIRCKFTRDVASTFEEVRAELIMAMGDLIPTSEYGA